MDFARKILSNYGWKEGDGLGKNSNGIAKPLKATLKFDNAGFGADLAADDFNNHWWERVFNEATTNVNVGREGEHVKMSLKTEDSVEISTKGYSMKKLEKLKKRGKKNGTSIYGNFLQASTLTNLGSEVENPDKINVNDIEVGKAKVLTDEELFKACGGRTAHKGARHGLKQSGKLSRIEKQEAELLAKMLAKRNELSESKCSLQTTSNKIRDEYADNELQEIIKECSSKNKKHKHSGATVKAETCSDAEVLINKKKKRKKTDIEVCDEVGALETAGKECEAVKKAKKKRINIQEKSHKKK